MTGRGVNAHCARSPQLGASRRDCFRSRALLCCGGCFCPAAAFAAVSSAACCLSSALRCSTAALMRSACVSCARLRASASASSRFCASACATSAGCTRPERIIASRSASKVSSFCSGAQAACLRARGKVRAGRSAPAHGTIVHHKSRIEAASPGTAYGTPCENPEPSGNLIFPEVAASARTRSIHCEASAMRIPMASKVSMVL